MERHSQLSALIQQGSQAIPASYRINKLNGNIDIRQRTTMPEHRTGTPARLSQLESFLWHDFDAGFDDWNVWVRRKMPHSAEATTTKSAFRYGMQLHAALRSLQAANSGMATSNEVAGRETFNRLVARYGIHPHLGEDGVIVLASDRPTDGVVSLMLAAFEAMQTGVWKRFKLCREPTCRASYYDASKPAAKTWCSMDTCGSRNKMRRYRAKT